jgi:hypothetical protein
MYKKDKILSDYAREVINRYDDHDRGKDSYKIDILELKLDMILTELDLYLYQQKHNLLVEEKR